MANELAINFEEISLDYGEENLNFNVTIEPTISLSEKSLELSVPTSVFHNDSGLRGIVRYLHDEKKLSFVEIANKLSRHINTIKTSYARSTKAANYTGKQIPISEFKSLPPLEAAANHLQKMGMRLTDIAHTLNRNPKTIWTALNRVRQK